jgi:predicted small integral membrane protein
MEALGWLQEPATMRRADVGYSDSKYLGLATVATVSLATFGAVGTNTVIALALSGAFMCAYWFIYGDQ